MCVWSLVDSILWIWASWNDGSIPDIIPVYFFARVLRVSRTFIFLSFADSTRSQISWIISLVLSGFIGESKLINRIQAFFTFGLACFTGSLFDSYGHKPLIIGGTVSLVLGFCMLSLCTEYYQFFLVHASLIAWGSNLL
jgi:hypothetical protein